MYLKSNQYPNIEYEKGKEIFFLPEELNSSFYFDVAKELTLSDEAMTFVALMLDEVAVLVKTAKAFLKKILADENSEYYQTVKYFMEFYKDEIDLATQLELFLGNDIDKLTLSDMVDFLMIARFASLLDNKTKQQCFVLDLSFNPSLTDELLVIFFDIKKQIFYVTHES